MVLLTPYISHLSHDKARAGYPWEKAPNNRGPSSTVGVFRLRPSGAPLRMTDSGWFVDEEAASICAMPAGYTYIMGSHSGTLYVGVTSEFDTRVRQHKNGTFEGFSKKYGCTRLLYYEEYGHIRNAISREKQIKGWRREKKLNLIRTLNPEFKDLAEKWGWKLITRHEKMKP